MLSAVFDYVKLACCLGCTACAVFTDSALADLAIVEVAPGIYRGPAPESPADYRRLRAMGINTVLDIRKFRKRQMEQERRCVNAYGMQHRSVPVGFRPQRDGSAERALRELNSVSLHPIYIHCELGRDRVGLVIGLYRVRIEGQSLRSAYGEMKRFGFQSRFRGLDRYFWERAKQRL